MPMAGVPGGKNLDISADFETIINLLFQRIRWELPHYFAETGKNIMAAMKSGRLQVKAMLGIFPTLIRY